MQGGTITIAGQSIRDIKVRSLRESFSVVAQDIVIFNNSIWENIRYVKPEASDEEVWRAAEAAEIADLIRARGGATVGPKGAQLSGGQKQRIAMARALLPEPDIVVLDEATSHVDAQTGMEIQKQLLSMADERVVISITHRIPTVRHADHILVLEDGQLAEEGVHEQLVNADGTYANLWRIQVGDVDGRTRESNRDSEVSQ